MSANLLNYDPCDMRRFGNLSPSHTLRRAGGEESQSGMPRFGLRRMTYGQVDQEARALRAAFSDFGIEAGDSVAVELTNRPEWIVCLLCAASSRSKAPLSQVTS